MKRSNRLDWEIIDKTRVIIGKYLPTGEMLVARSKAELMSKINEFDRGL